MVQQRALSARRTSSAVFQCRTRLCGWCNVEDCGIKFANLCFNAARGFVGGATASIYVATDRSNGFNAARGFVGGATKMASYSDRGKGVSMPHAALWVVQQTFPTLVTVSLSGFNAARGFVGGATSWRF